MIAYMKTIAILDDDGDKIGELEHSVDDVYLFIPTKGQGAFADDYKFIAKTLESFTGIQFSDNGLSHLHESLYEVAIKER